METLRQAACLSPNGLDHYDLPGAPRQLLVATMDGVLSLARDGSGAWEVSAHGLLGHHVESLMIVPGTDTVLAGTHGNGMFRSNRFGFTKGRLAVGENEDNPAWTIGINPIVFPYMLASGPGDSGIRRHYQMGVPIDDTTTWHFQYFCYVFPPELGAPEQDFVPYAEVPLEVENGESILDYVLAQDMAAWAEQGPITDRTREHLGKRDACVIAYRKLLEQEIQKVAEGKEPMNVFHDENVDSLELTIPGAQKAAPGLGSGGLRVVGTDECARRGRLGNHAGMGCLHIEPDSGQGETWKLVMERI